MKAFGNMLGDHVTIRRPDGTVVGANVPASVQNNLIFIDDTSLPIQAGDSIIRQLRNGLQEEFIVDDPTCYEGGPLAHYEIKCHRRGSEPKGHQPSTVYYLTGTNARVNIGSHDASQNVVYQGATSEELFSAMEGTLRSVVTPEQGLQRLIDRLEGMRGAVNTPTFAERYVAFIDAAASHLTLIQPFLPALATLLLPGHS